KGIALWVIHGARDNVVDPLQSMEMVSALLGAGAHPRMSLYEFANHNSWDPAFAEPELLPWLFSHKRTKPCDDETRHYVWKPFGFGPASGLLPAGVGTATDLLQSHKHRLRVYPDPKFCNPWKTSGHSGSRDCQLQGEVLSVFHKPVGLLVER